MSAKEIKGYREAKDMIRFFCNKDFHNQECINALKKEILDNMTVESFQLKMKIKMENWTRLFKD